METSLAVPIYAPHPGVPMPPPWLWGRNHKQSQAPQPHHQLQRSQVLPCIPSETQIHMASPPASPHLPLLLQLRLAHRAEGPILAAGQLRQVPVWGC